jgi:hypothetical protein
VAQRDEHGRFLRGSSGNPGGEMKAPRAIRALAMQHSVEALDKLIEHLRSDDAELSLRELWSMLVCGVQAATCSSAACTGSPSRKRTPWITWASRCEPSNRRQLRSAALASL